ncbi:unnamed protein product [Brachionus calyciflorus]|uniref:EGF-like domain-containing protein n=1 Tax=Brachionus calyciflorus TaxID=104777 RepID=A0A813P587_9BILA|nr:unnamed protein product [Brachionus calyciflorus]
MIRKILILSLTLLISKSYVKAQAQVTCTANSCGSNGNCEIENNAIVCTCKPGFVGSKCQLFDPCSLKPCGVNGACFPIISTQNLPGQVNPIEQVNFHCQCYSGFTGDNCQNAPAKPCNSNPCLNNGICVNRNNSYDFHCICVGSYTGKDCGIFIDVCAHNKCENEGVCVPGLDKHNYTCSCKNGFYGEFCQNEIDECKINVNGVETTPCQNNATCYDLVDAYFCECNGPYVGQNCETYVNPCNKNPCGAGAVCIANGNSYFCQCAAGFFGSPCQPNPCISNPCKQPGSTCVPVEAGALVSFIPNCTCVNPQPSYICVCPSTNPPYASTLC